MSAAKRGCRSSDVPQERSLGGDNPVLLIVDSVRHGPCTPVPATLCLRGCAYAAQRVTGRHGNPRGAGRTRRVLGRLRCSPIGFERPHRGIGAHPLRSIPWSIERAGLVPFRSCAKRGDRGGAKASAAGFRSGRVLQLDSHFRGVFCKPARALLRSNGGRDEGCGEEAGKGHLNSPFAFQGTDHVTQAQEGATGCNAATSAREPRTLGARFGYEAVWWVSAAGGFLPGNGMVGTPW